jgi:ABC-type Fe3+/spermidine/putrescine transport system ATPase subunit
MALLTVEDVCLDYQGTPTLAHIDFSLDAGEILCLLGPSGSGKTTLLRVVSGLESPDRGRVFFDGEDLAQVPPYRRRFGLMFQDYALFPHKDVFGNVAFGLEVQNLSTAAVRDRVAEVLQLVGLAGFEKRSVSELSGGERQRVALARSLAPQPGLLMLDEPLGALDRSLRDRLAGEIRGILKKVGVSTLFVTHDQEEAFAMADRVAVLDLGRLMQIDTPEGLYRHPGSVAVARFLGFGNIVDAAVDADGTVRSEIGRWDADCIDLPRETTGRLVVRPEAGRIAESAAAGDAGPMTIHGTVVRCQFQGKHFRLSVKVGSRPLAFDLPNHTRPPQAGETVRLWLRPEAVVFLPDGQAVP